MDIIKQKLVEAKMEQQEDLPVTDWGKNYEDKKKQKQWGLSTQWITGVSYFSQHNYVSLLPVFSSWGYAVVAGGGGKTRENKNEGTRVTCQFVE